MTVGWVVRIIRKLKKKHFLIIGGTKGIGKIIVNTLAKQGHTLSVVSWNVSTSKPDKKNANIHYVRLDLAREEQIIDTIAKILKKNGKVSHLIFCQRHRGTDDPWRGEFAVSLTATKKIIEQVCDSFDDTFEKSIVIINSLASFLVGLEQPLSYHVAKAGLSQLVKYYAVVLGSKGIRVNCVSPCTILKDESRQFYLSNRKLYALYQHITPLGRMGTAQDISDIVLFLCSPASSFITGQNIIADGGLTLQSQEALARSVTSLTHPALQKP